MHNWVIHFCNEMVLFPWVPFIQMHMVNNISLDLLIGIWTKNNNFIMKIIVWLFMIKKLIC
jgi:hypothetical protein